MTSKTHIAVGTAVTTAIIRPETTKYLAICLVASTVGSIISDTDLTTSELHKDLDKIIIITVASILLCLLLDFKFNFGIISYVQSQAHLVTFLIGFFAFLGLALFGIHTSHRTFMHSLLGVSAFTTDIYFLLPIAALPFAIGMLSHIFLDLFNLKKVQIFYPLDFKLGFKLCSSDGIVNNILLVVGLVSLFLEFCFLL